MVSINDTPPPSRTYLYCTIHSAGLCSVLTVYHRERSISVNWFIRLGAQGNVFCGVCTTSWCCITGTDTAADKMCQKMYIFNLHLMYVKIIVLCRLLWSCSLPLMKKGVLMVLLPSSFWATQVYHPDTLASSIARILTLCVKAAMMEWLPGTPGVNINLPEIRKQFHCDLRGDLFVGVLIKIRDLGPR